MKSLLSLVVCVVVIVLVGCSAVSAGDSSYVNFTGNVTQIREYSSGAGVTRREIWLAVKTTTGVKTFQFRCAPGHPTFGGCVDQTLLAGCTITGIGGSNETETYSGFACSSGYGKCRELSGMADRQDDGRIIFDLNTNSSISGCTPK